jgi:long-subunit fatty acid transport protein
MKRKSIIALLAVLCAGVLRPSCLLGAGDITEEFAQLGSGARPAGMGGAFGAVANDINAIDWNPAGLAQLETSEVSLTYLMYLQGININYVGYVQSVGDESGIGLNLSYLHLSESILDDLGQPTGTFLVDGIIFSLGYATWVSGNLSMGANLKTVYTSFYTDISSRFAVDLGGLYRSPIDSLYLGFVARNIDTGMSFAGQSNPLPLNLRAGLAYRMLRDKLIISSDVSEYPKYGKINLSAGMEYRIGKRDKSGFALRAGYTNENVGQIQGVTGISIGFGLNSDKMGFDYAWVPYGILDDVQRVTFTMIF